MAGLLLLGLLACASIAIAQPPLLVLTEMCYYSMDIDYIERQFWNSSLRVVATEDTCGDWQKLLRNISSYGGPILGSLRAEVCSEAHFMARLYNFTLLTWNCPQDLINSSRIYQSLTPSVHEIAGAFLKMVSYMKWKSIIIVTIDADWWPIVSLSIEVKLRENGIVPKYVFLLPRDASYTVVEEKLNIIKRHSTRAVLICAPANYLGKTVLRAIDSFTLARDQGTRIILLDVLTLPSWKNLFAKGLKYDTYDVVERLSNEFNNTVFYTKISLITKQHLLLFGDASDSFESGVVRNIEKILAKLEGNQVNAFDYVLWDLSDNGTRRGLLKVKAFRDSSGFELQVLKNMDEWNLKHGLYDECDGCDSEFSTIYVFLIFGCSSILVSFMLGTFLLIRQQLLKKKVSKGPFKVLLTATDFVFPQIADSRRVDEGIEAMLCCWLQQLQEFGGPEVDKPDLLQGSSGSMRTPIKGGSSPNLAKQLIVDLRVRYNGDLVQMKPVPSGNNSVEIKSKAVEVLSVLHGLRHENINPLIGCLAEPPRAALVSEWCARGSLQDVLQQDDIKLDWSFRLSLLTDLVRGMKYLHSTPIRVHGYLTSRNCVIDARWVLKVTDYGLPAFYEAQGISPPAKSARELLWTSPELLRHSSTRKKGTQPGDVYSFGIILQEVVVRGEPFCMLALTPEEIIEKVKAPPPLIRPSVSKGAAPPEVINIMRQCWAEQADMRPDFNAVHDLFKKLNHGRKVNIVDTMFQMLEKYSNNLEELIRERTEQLDFEKKKTEQLLNRMLPSPVAEKLKLGMPVDPEEFAEVTIYFSDIVGFTTISAHSTPFQVVDLLNDLYTCFDATINAYNVYKVETIGDAYMVVGGLPVRIPDHAEQIATMALDLLHQSGMFRIRHLPGTPLRLRIGLHSGPCCAGVVGLTMPRYCLFGDTVNTASRMESTGAAWRIHLSEATKERLEHAGGYQLEYRGPTEIKGKGTMHTYWLLGKNGFDKPLPVPPPIEESHGLDESLVICQSSEHNTAYDTYTEDTSNREKRATLEHHPESQPKSPNPSVRPTFMKSMENSKFSTLQKNSHDLYNKHDLHMVKSTSSDTPMSLGTPVSASEVAAALLGASTSSLCGYRNRHRKIEEEDISTPYSHYKSLSPKQRIGKLLRRQFSLDRTEESRAELSPQSSPRLCKQNSAGAVDLEKIEEVPLKVSSPSPNSATPIHCTLSISADSLIH